MLSNIQKILDKARWAPSGDNEQPWRIQITSSDSCDVTVGYFLDTPFHLKRIPDQIALGSLLETFHIAASDLGFQVQCNVKERTDAAPIYQLSVVAAPDVSRDPLADFIEKRAVNRFPYSRKSLSEDQKQQVQKNLPSGYTMIWFEENRRMDFANLVFQAGVIRYALPEMFAVHSKIVDWQKDLSPDKVPSKAMGVPLVFLPLIKWLLAKPEHMEGYNRFFKGDVSTALQLEFLPSILSAAGIAIIADKAPVTPQDWVQAGRAIQRFWLTAASLGLSHQPAFTPLIFSKYVDQGSPLSLVEAINIKNKKLCHDLAVLLGGDAQKHRAIWMGRVGFAKPVTSRSVRLSLEDLLHR